VKNLAWLTILIDLTMILDSGLLFWATLYRQGGPKKVSHYHKPSLNRIINRY